MDTVRSKTRWRLIAMLVVTAVLASFPVRTLAARYYHHRAGSLLRDANAGILEERAAAEKLIDVQGAALLDLGAAARLAPFRAKYRKALSDVHARRGAWAGVMESMGEELPPGMPPSAESMEKAEAELREAIRLEPTNPDYHFSLALLHDRTDSYSGSSEKELARAVSLFPVNSALRYAVALQHLNAGRRGDALEHATRLAAAEGMSFDGKSRAWLFKAFEIAWRATNDAQVVQGISPEDREALKVLKEYVKWKGIE